MVELRREETGSGPVVAGFSGRGFKVGERRFAGGILLTIDTAIDWVPPPVAQLSVDDIAALLAIDPAPEFLLLGTGDRLVQPSAALRKALDVRGIGLEVMDSRAAARTLTVLRAEERWIGVALYPLG